MRSLHAEKIGGFLLDVWGTMVYPIVSLDEYWECRAEAVARVLRDYGYERSRETVLRALRRARHLAGMIRELTMHEVRIEGELVIFLRELGITSVSRGMMVALRAAYMKPYLELTRPAVGLREFLDLLKERGIRVAVVSNTLDGMATREMLHRHGLLGYIDYMSLSDEVGFVKPHPKIFLDALSGIGTGPSEVVMVGDELCDALGARGLGIPFIRYGGFTTADSPAIPGPTVTSYHELIKLLSSA